MNSDKCLPIIKKAWIAEMREAILALPSFGLIGGRKNNPMISRKAVLEILDRPSKRQKVIETLEELKQKVLSS